MSEGAGRVGLQINATKKNPKRISARHDDTIHTDNKEIEDVDNLSILEQQDLRKVVTCRT